MPRLLAALALLAAPLAGQTIEEQHSPIPGLLQAVSPVSDQVVWVSGHRGAVLRTLDGGVTWVPRPVVTGADTILQFRDIQARSADEAWVMSAGNGPDSRIYHTRDGGAHWTLQFQNADSAAFYDCMTFFDARTGVAFSDASHGRSNVLRTIDGGATWALLPPSAVPAPLEGEGAFAASGGCLTSIDGQHGWVALGAPGARIWRTTDAGATWTSHDTPLVRSASAGGAAAAFRDPMHGIVVGGDMGDYRNDAAAAAVATTSDGGITWTLGARPGLRGTPFGVTWIPELPQTALLASPGGLSLTRDEGKSWSTASEGVFWSVGASGRTAWAVGAAGRNGRIVRLSF
ncbi:MAG TPA: YCF48-related protein [Gemmatimonadales bacterium]|nr:YCF48-related protein [Gemmatimonadales bacterium]